MHVSKRATLNIKRTFKKDASGDFDEANSERLHVEKLHARAGRSSATSNAPPEAVDAVRRSRARRSQLCDEVCDSAAAENTKRSIVSGTEVTGLDGEPAWFGLDLQTPVHVVLDT